MGRGRHGGRPDRRGRRLGRGGGRPGFLPHLSGHDNLDLYWRATGRPLAEAHLDEALKTAGLGVELSYSVLAVVALPAMSLLAGTVTFGWRDVELPTGGTVPVGTALGRMAIIVGYSLIAQLVVAALAFLLSVTTDSPLGAVGGAVGLVIVSNILDAVTALGSWRDFLPTHWMYAWMDALQPDVQWTGMAKGTAISVSYAAILFALAFRRFRTRDITS